MEKKEIYESPLVEVVEVHVEQGFANSKGSQPTGNTPGLGDGGNW